MINTQQSDNPAFKGLTPGERVKYSILGNRLGITGENAWKVLNDLKLEAARTLGISDTSINADVDFSGRDYDLVLTINKQNTPK